MAAITPLLVASGAGPLAWWRIKNCDLRDDKASLPLLEAYRYHTLQAILHENNLRKTLTIFRSRGVDPVLVKGWAIARLYPEVGLRLYGDIDLCILPDQFQAALDIKQNTECKSLPLDLHKGFEKLDDRKAEDIYARSRMEDIGGVEVRVLGPEDQLRILCLHTLRHGVIRPIWLCDVAVALESRPANFDWDICLGGSGRRADYVACAIGLAHQLLGAEIADTPVARRARELPKWMAPSVLALWSAKQRPQGIRTPMAHYLRDPSGVIRALLMRWPGPIEATVDVSGPFNEWPRLPFQIGDALLRTARFIKQIPESIR